MTEPRVRARLFGTDGVRGVANIEPMTVETSMRLGRSAAHVFKDGVHRHRILIGKDTRLSGYMLENALTAGICSMGVNVFLVGPLPTPGIAYVTRSLRVDAGIVISASHNPYQDNGIKFFSGDGFKLSDETEHTIEELTFTKAIDDVRPTADEVGKARRIDDAQGRYVEHVKRSFPRGQTLENMKIVIDCAHGAGYKVGPWVLHELGADLECLGCAPDGKNINDGVGSLYPESAARVVRERGAALGICLDGDGDRCLLIDEKGSVVDGDHVLAICGRAGKHDGTLSNGTVVATVMSNFGLERSLAEVGVSVHRTDVGDRFVVEAMRSGGHNIGGEQSGHTVFLDHTTTGDGMVTALQVLRVMVESGKPLSELATCMTPMPQVLENVEILERTPIDQLPTVVEAIRDAETTLAGAGRVLVRYSGTQPLARVMIEGEREEQIRELAGSVVAALRDAIGDVS
ncbi:MAG: phosphoglucosamine mutase [Acidobacteriota bacterium]|jgi:phosphoglucosamine mutase